MIKSKSDYLFYISEDAKNNAVKRINPITNWLINKVIWGGGKSNMGLYCNSAQVGVLYKLPHFI